jgi:hypothetical protein
VSVNAATTQDCRPPFEVELRRDVDSNTGTVWPFTGGVRLDWGIKKSSSTATRKVFEEENDAPWFASCVKQIQSLRKDIYKYEDYSADPPNDIAIDLAIDALKIFADFGLKPHRIASSSDEGVCISFRNENRYAHLECFNDGDQLVVTDIGSGSPEIWDATEIGVPVSVARIKAFIE